MNLKVLLDFLTVEAPLVITDYPGESLAFCIGALSERLINRYNFGKSDLEMLKFTENLAEMALKPIFPV